MQSLLNMFYANQTFQSKHTKRLETCFIVVSLFSSYNIADTDEETIDVSYHWFCFGLFFTVTVLASVAGSLLRNFSCKRDVIVSCHFSSTCLSSSGRMFPSLEVLKKITAESSFSTTDAQETQATWTRMAASLLLQRYLFQMALLKLFLQQTVFFPSLGSLSRDKILDW